MNENIFDKVEKKTKVKKEDILTLARSLQNKNLKDERDLRQIIKDVASLAGTEVSKVREEKIIDAKKRQKIILKAIDELPYKMRKVVVLFEFEDFTVSEIAKKLGEPEGTIKSRLFNARKVLAEKLKFLLGENK